MRREFSSVFGAQRSSLLALFSGRLRLLRPVPCSDVVDESSRNFYSRGASMIFCWVRSGGSSPISVFPWRLRRSRPGPVLRAVNGSSRNYYFREIARLYSLDSKMGGAILPVIPLLLNRLRPGPVFGVAKGSSRNFAFCTPGRTFFWIWGIRCIDSGFLSISAFTPRAHFLGCKGAIAKFRPPPHPSTHPGFATDFARGVVNRPRSLLDIPILLRLKTSKGGINAKHVADPCLVRLWNGKIVG